MADAKISQLPVATTPLAGTELVPVVQGGVTDQTTVEAILTGTVPSGTANGVLYLNASKVVTSGSALTFDGFTIVNNQGSSGTSIAGNALLGLQDDVNAVISFNVPDANAAGLFFGYGGNPYWAGVEKDGNVGLKFIAAGNSAYLTSTGLGIGTSSPNSKLTIKLPSIGSEQTLLNFQLASSTSSAANFTYNQVDDSLKIINVSNYAGSSLQLGTNNSTKVTLDYAGNLGLGVTPSAWGGISASMQLGDYGNITSTGTRLWLGTNYYFNSGEKYTGTGAATRYRQSDGLHIWDTATSGTAGNAISFSQVMTLDASGRLGLGGVTSPLATLDVGGTSGTLVRIGTNIGNGSTNYFPVIVGDGNSSGGGTNQTFVRIGRFSDGTAGIDAFEGGVGNAALAFGAFGTERARITSGGDLYVGTASAIAGSNARLQIDSGSTYGQVTKSGGAATSANTTLWHVATTDDNIFVDFGTETSFTSRGSISYNRAGGLVAYNTTSDYRAKDIIGPVQNPGATIDSLKVYEGVMKGATRSRPMLIAHEAQEHAPYAVSGVKDELNEDGTPKFQQMDVSSLVPLLLAEIQSLRARVAALEA